MGEVLGIGVDKVVFLEVAKLVALRDLHNLGQRGISKLNIEFFKFPEKRWTMRVKMASPGAKL